MDCQGYVKRKLQTQNVSGVIPQVLAAGGWTGNMSNRETNFCFSSFLPGLGTHLGSSLFILRYPMDSFFGSRGRKELWEHLKVSYRPLQSDSCTVGAAQQAINSSQRQAIFQVFAVGPQERLVSSYGYPRGLIFANREEKDPQEPPEPAYHCWETAHRAVKGASTVAYSTVTPEYRAKDRALINCDTFCSIWPLFQTFSRL